MIVNGEKLLLSWSLIFLVIHKIGRIRRLKWYFEKIFWNLKNINLTYFTVGQFYQRILHCNLAQNPEKECCECFITLSLLNTNISFDDRKP